MAKHSNDLERREELRRRTSVALETRYPDPSTLPAEELRSLVHELRVYQIELEVQNQELRETQAKLQAARDRYVDLYDFAPVGYLTLDDRDVLCDANLEAASLLGVERRSWPESASRASSLPRIRTVSTPTAGGSGGAEGRRSASCV